MSSDPIAQLVAHLARLPGIGDKTATRLAFHLVRGPRGNVRELAAALLDVVDKVRLCSSCANVNEADPCALCADASRDAHTICVVAGPSDVVAIERGAHFRGRYHVLHGLLSPLEGVGPEDLRIDALLRRLAPDDAGVGPAVGEVILATSANVEGEATAMYLARLIKPLGVEVTRIASGIPVGGELEYSDQATIARALRGRAPM
jgi:recombination protein RecR